MRTPTEATYDTVLGVCNREHEQRPWCMTHASWIQRTAPHCDRRHFLQRTVEHVLKTMEGEER